MLRVFTMSFFELDLRSRIPSTLPSSSPLVDAKTTQQIKYVA